MCGILFSSKLINNLDDIIEYLKKRGPDHTEYLNINNYEFVHVLLSMTGNKFTIQPFTYDDNNIVILFNGEIYNFKEFGNFNSDGECIIESYKKYGDNFIKMLDGEFAILLVDFSKNLIYYSTDIFSTKPLWVSNDSKDIGIASYESSLLRLGFKNINQVPANTTIKMSLPNKKIISKNTVYDFDLKQHKSNFKDWNKAFENAIIKRTKNIKHGIFIGLSSGYDSGLISCCLNKLNIKYKAYTINGGETKEIIDEREKNTENIEFINLDSLLFKQLNNNLKKNCEKYILKIDNGDYDNYINMLIQIEENNGNIDLIKKLEIKKQKYLNMHNYRMNGQLLVNDNGSIGMSYICSKARKEGRLIYLSGCGADEIISDYGFNGVKHQGHSTIGGYFPENLKDVFPWKNFFDNTQRAYLMKEEMVSGASGIEGRYPFLDKYVVQEFLWLSNDLKNKNYKSVIHNYFVENNYPFENNIKVGFNCGFTGFKNDYEEKNNHLKNRDKTPLGTYKNKNLIVDFEILKKINNYKKKKNL
jgi:asparagine synthetase B (glutamine-hydrolysing)